MTPPLTLTVGHATFAISQDRRACDAENADGLFEAGSRRILLRPRMPRDREREVLVHEALHACVEVSRGHGLDHDAEERLVDALTGAVLSLIRLNPDFLAYLTD